jgi:hypothetical protein
MYHKFDVTGNLLFAQFFFKEVNTAKGLGLDAEIKEVLRGVWFGSLKFNKHRSIFVLFDKKFPILD